MGWLRLKRDAQTLNTSNVQLPQKYDKRDVDHIEYVVSQCVEKLRYLRVSTDIADKDLPFISAAEVRSCDGKSGPLWIVVDNIVYDCTDFALDHPGGAGVIQSFGGKDCSWQFWRFHNDVHMKDFGRELRIGRTEGIKNPFKEPPRFLGLRRIGFGAQDEF